METIDILNYVVGVGMAYKLVMTLVAKYKFNNTAEATYNLVFACFLAISLTI